MQPEEAASIQHNQNDFNFAIKRFLTIDNAALGEKAHQSIIHLETSQMYCSGVNFHCCISTISEQHIPWGPTGPGDEKRSHP